jgi:calnexin
VFKGIEGDKGLVVKDKAAHHAISAKFPKAITNKKDTLVVQYEVKLQGEWWPVCAFANHMY